MSGQGFTVYRGQRTTAWKILRSLGFDPILCFTGNDGNKALQEAHDCAVRSLRTISFTAWGLAWPFVAFITWPTKNLNTPSLPDLNLARLSGFLAMISRAASSMAASVT